MPGGVTRIAAHPPASSFTPMSSVEVLLEGTPNERVVTHFVNEDKKLACGVWAADSYKEHIPSYPGDELFVVIEGSATVTIDGGDPETFSAGDAFVIWNGTTCTFEVRGPFLKYWMSYTA